MQVVANFFLGSATHVDEDGIIDEDSFVNNVKENEEQNNINEQDSALRRRGGDKKNYAWHNTTSHNNAALKEGAAKLTESQISDSIKEVGKALSKRKKREIQFVPYFVWLCDFVNDEEVNKQCYWILRRYGPGFENQYIEKPMSKVMIRRFMERNRHLGVEEHGFATEVIPGYHMCMITRIRDGKDKYPQIFELRWEHDDTKLILAALKEDEVSAVKIFKIPPGESIKKPDAEKRSVIESWTPEDFCRYYVASVVPSYLGSCFDVKLCDGSYAPIKIRWHFQLGADRPRRLDCWLDSKTKLENIPPSWDRRRQKYTLPFFGRVKKTSAKNFQLRLGTEDEKDAQPIILFGKITSNLFSCDYTHPLSLLDAFSIGIAAIARKTAVA